MATRRTGSTVRDDFDRAEQRLARLMERRYQLGIRVYNPRCGMETPSAVAQLDRLDAAIKRIQRRIGFLS